MRKQAPLDRIEARIYADPDLTMIRRCTVEHPFGTIKRMSEGENAPDAKWRGPLFRRRGSPRLQAFPDTWRFYGSASEAMRQLGNAVPTTLGEVVARSIYAHLSIPKSLALPLQVA